MSDEKKDGDKKIIVDEDWKSRVAAEKEAFAHGGAPAAADGAAPGAAAPPASGTASSAGGPEPLLPPASFEMLVTTLATEAMIGLGQLPHPMTGQFHADSAQARYAIDMLEMLAEKTRGNLTSGEDRGMRDLLHQLRMAFLAAPKGGPADESASPSA